MTAETYGPALKSKVQFTSTGEVGTVVSILLATNEMVVRLDRSQQLKRLPWPNTKPRGSRPQHGTRSRYVHMGCRCVECTDAATSYTRERRARLRGA